MLPRLGGVPERPKGSDCKSDVYDFEGSNPSPSTRFSASCKLCGYSLVVEPQPSKLMMRVRFPLPAPCLWFMHCVLLL
ncbi:Zn-dependent amino- or carboxypeptidase [Pseudomonas syringae pv. actinidiae]|uniref:Zn-dependent amino-or carboxypeptidase n=1 Tax=Pseudomonas syringae pv. actinidiae TaxID=103796 RepID=A0A2V0Q9Y1_PSESF|nr:Zn-dependent amino- or carboxypeptidase [Pseudomonas syringae pv. actinidiae]